MKITPFNNTCILDAVFQPGEKIYSVKDLVELELSRLQKNPNVQLPIDQGSNFSLTAEYFQNLGYQNVAISEKSEPSHLAVLACEKILAKNNIQPSDIDLFLYYNTNPHSSETHHNISTKIVAKLGLSNVSFSLHVTQKNCTSALFAMELAGAMMEANPKYNYALIAGGDCVDVDSSQPRIVNRQIHSDAGSSIILSRHGRKIGYLKNKTRPIAWKRFCSSTSEFNEIAVKYLSWSLKELQEAQNGIHLLPNGSSFIATNQSLLDQYLRKNLYSQELISFYKEHLSKYGNSQCHQIINAVEVVIREVSSDAIFHATGLGNTMSTLVISSEIRT